MNMALRDFTIYSILKRNARSLHNRAACEYCVSEADSNLVYPNPMYANVTKLFFADNWHQATKYLQDIAGGIVATAPSGKDYFNPETHDMIEKYLGGKAGVPTEHRLRLIKLIRDLTSSYEAILTAIIIIMILFMPEGICRWIRDKVEITCPRCKIINMRNREVCRVCDAPLHLEKINSS